MSRKRPARKPRRPKQPAAAKKQPVPGRRARRAATAAPPVAGRVASARATAAMAPPPAMARLAGGGRRSTRDAPRNRRAPPYVRLLQRSGSIAIWQVDGAFVRKNITAEFGNFGHHYSFGEIPRDEVWLDAEQQLDEERFFIRRAVTERRLMARGMDYEAAHAVAIAEERRLHAHAGDVSRTPPGGAAYGDGLSD